MNLRQLRYFCEIVEAGSAVAAASRLHVAPTALSMQLGQLEEELGGELFDRSRRPMDLTALGRYFHPRAKALLADAAHLQQEASSVAAGRSGVLAIGYTRSTIFSILPNAIQAFRSSHPNVKVELMSLLSEHQHAELQTGRIQVGVSRYVGPVPSIDELEFKRLLDDPFVVALPATNPLARRKLLHPADLSQTGLITYPKDPQSRFAEHTIALLREAGGQSPVAHEASDIHTALGMVASHLGFCLVGRSVEFGSRRDLAFVPMSRLADKAAVFAVTKTGEQSKVALDFVETLVATTARAARVPKRTAR
ncbi:LysR family transcriptional regulator [Ideonella sp. YS5]|uniref:LysR family transcriptional regulator n=1 Tax=Ideonella sp. YS5 TaxID=3453714 RepID=UPI003EEBBF16